MKKLVLVMSALAMLVVLAACGSSDGGQGSNGGQDSNGGQKTEKAKTEAAPATTPDVQVAPDQGGDTPSEESSQGPDNKM
ncbi:MAG: hypothetical protein WA990_02385, partial [Rubrobacteraceae bacterium]